MGTVRREVAASSSLQNVASTSSTQSGLRFELPLCVSRSNEEQQKRRKHEGSSCKGYRDAAGRRNRARDHERCREGSRDCRRSRGCGACPEEHAIGGDAIDKTGVPLPDETLAACKASDSVLLAAIGGYKWDNLSSKMRPEGGLLQLRAGLDCFANLRPATLQDELVEGSPLKPEIIKGVDIMIVRELVGGIYFGEPRGFKDASGNECAKDSGAADAGYNTMVYKKSEVERIARVAFEIAKARKGNIVSVDKANVLEVSQLWRQTVADAFEEDGCKDQKLTLSNMYVDNCAMQLTSTPDSLMSFSRATFLEISYPTRPLF